MITLNMMRGVCWLYIFHYFVNKYSVVMIGVKGRE